jgi:hypothetical protein
LSLIIRHACDPLTFTSAFEVEMGTE